jgi:hypothetical protein
LILIQAEDHSCKLHALSCKAYASLLGLKAIFGLKLLKSHYLQGLLTCSSNLKHLKLKQLFKHLNLLFK